MTHAVARREADAGASSRPLDENDKLFQETIDDAWFDEADKRMCREFVRQLQQQENSFVTTSKEERLANVRALDQLQRTLERLASRQTKRAVRRSTKEAVNPDDEFDALEQRLVPLIERARKDADR